MFHNIRSSFISLFRRTEKARVNDIVWMNEQYKFEACAAASKNSDRLLILVWFEHTRRKLASLFYKEGLDDNNIRLVPQVTSLTLHNAQFVFAEHHPMLAKEEAIFSELQLKEATVYSSLDEPLLKKFGGEKVAALMQQMGASDSESFSHSAISASIRNAQQKVSKHVTVDQYATSQEDWLEKNIPATGT